MKRALDLLLSSTLLVLVSPLLIILLMAIYILDKSWPIYSPVRVGKNFMPFHMHKMRTMIVGADKNKIDTTGLNDSRITKIGFILRRYKLDELPQLWNVFVGQMSFVGPRPQIDREVRLYTIEEQGLLEKKPGITDFSSIVFSDLAQIVANTSDPNIAYNQLIRPWKSRLGLFYIKKSSLFVDITLMILTIVSLFSKTLALLGIVKLLKILDAPQDLIEICKRDKPLIPTPPPGSDEIVTTRN